MRCKVCGDIARGNNYGVTTCMSCKVFFQRHGLKNTNTFQTVLQCRFTNGPCEITPNTRKRCAYCRLNACIQVGMRRNWQQFQEKNRRLIEQKYKQTQLSTLDLLLADRSSLHSYQWGVISNVTHVYDRLFEEQNQKLDHLRISQGQKPVKIRLKMANYQELVSTYFEFIVPFLEHIPDYQTLDISDRTALIHHNMITLTGIHSHYASSTTGFIPHLDKVYAPLVELMYGNEITVNNERLRQQLDSIFHTDLVLVKLLLVILGFSNYTSCLTSTSPIINDEMNFAKKLFTIQNYYVDILWRYMLFRFRDGNLVVHLYSKIIYNCLHVQKFTHQVSEENNLHKDMYENLIEEIEEKLSLHDEF